MTSAEFLLIMHSPYADCKNSYVGIDSPLGIYDTQDECLLAVGRNYAQDQTRPAFKDVSYKCKMVEYIKAKN
jgi:hypothetical protein